MESPNEKMAETVPAAQHTGYTNMSNDRKLVIASIVKPPILRSRIIFMWKAGQCYMLIKCLL